MRPIFSIIIPVYNVALHLRECLDSVLAQTYVAWEAICFDDGSSDGSGEILDEYAEKDHRFQVFHQKNLGVSVARNKALDVINGEWFLFLDSDDCLRVDALEILLANGVDDNTDCVLVTPYIPKWDGVAISPRVLDSKILIDNASKEDLLLGPYAANGFVISRVYRRSIFGGLRFHVDMHMAEDVCFWFDALKFDARWRIVQAEYYLYRLRPDSACGRKNPHDCVAVLDSVLYAFEAINTGVLSIKNGAKIYLRRFPFFSKNYLNLVIEHASVLSSQEWFEINERWNRIQKVIVRWPFDKRMKIRFWLARHTMTRRFVWLVDLPDMMLHWIGCCWAFLDVKRIMKKLMGRA